MGKTVLHQLKTLATVITGMSYVIQADDGSVIVIDGGYDNDAEGLVEFLQKITGEEIPTVAIWFITHAHVDHTFACQAVARRLSHKVRVKKMAYRFPDAELIEKIQPAVNGEISVFEKALENFGAQKITPSIGDRYVFGKTEFEILFTCEDLPPYEEAPKQDLNDTSLVIRMTVEGQRVLFLGDVQAVADIPIIRRHGKNLKSDICQIAHHGWHLSSTAELYDLIDPEILLWPMREDWIDSAMLLSDVDRHLIGDLHVKEVILAGHGTRSLVLPARPSENPYLPPMPKGKTHCKPEVRIVRGSPSLQRMDDPAWEKAEDYSQYPDKEDYPEGVCARTRFLWDENALYIRAELRKDFVPSDPERIGTAQCNNIRLFLSEEAVTDLNTKWEEILGEGVYDKLKIYPEQKRIDGGNTTHPRICQSVAFLYEGGYTTVSRIAFTKAHKRGDRLSLNVELSAVKLPGGNRAYVFYTVPAQVGRACHQLPVTLALAELTD